MGYKHVEIEASQLSKHYEQPCGDVFSSERTPAHTTMILSDGLGHGVKANIAAQMCVSRLQELFRLGHSLRDAFMRVVKSMNEYRGTDMPYAVFSVIRIASDGMATVLTYDMPPPIIVSQRYANVVKMRPASVEQPLVGEANCFIETGEGIMMMTDGVTQSGLGTSFVKGWGSDGVCAFLNECLSQGARKRAIPNMATSQARKHWGRSLGDDVSAAIAYCRAGRTVNLLTGPPRDRMHQCEVVKKFLAMDGIKVVCGGTTATIVADCMGKKLTMDTAPQSLISPPIMMIDGIDLVTEGAVTLNQVYNVLDEDPSRFDEESGVTQLHSLLRSADRINVLMGMTVNPATQDISFLQRGILTRHSVVPLIAQRLRDRGKLVVVEHV